MSGIIVTNESKPRELIPAATHIARCVRMIHVGTVEEEFMGEKKLMNKVRITWELPEETRVFKEENGPQPMIIDKTYTLSLHEKATLRKDLEAWRGRSFTDEEVKAFDITKLIGVPCLMSIIHEPKPTKPGQMKEKIASLSPLMKGMVCPPQVNPSAVLTYSDWNEELFQSLPQFIKEEIMRSNEYKALHHPALTESAPEPMDDLPF